MPVELSATYSGDLHCQLTHGPSGETFWTDAPVDNGGLGRSFSPTDLVGAGLGSCILTIMGLVARRHGLDIAGTTARVTKEMVAQPTRRIGALRVTIRVPADKARALTDQDRRRMEAAAGHCPVHASLHPEVKVTIDFRYEPPAA